MLVLLVLALVIISFVTLYLTGNQFHPHLRPTYVVSCFSPSQLQSDLDAVPWSLLEVFDDPDDKLTVFNLLLKDVVDKCAPLVKKKQRKCVSYGLPMIFIGK